MEIQVEHQSGKLKSECPNIHSPMAEAPALDSYVDDLYFAVLSDENAQHVFPVSDATYAEELQFQEAVMASTIISLTSSSPSSSVTADGLKFDSFAAAPSSPITIRENRLPRQKEFPVEEAVSVGESSLSFCEICFERKEKYQMFKMESCVHSYCTGCIIRHVATKVQENIITVTCPSVDCKTVLEIDAFRSALPNEVLQLWEYLLCQNLIDDSEKFYCPFKDCSAMLLKENEGEEIIRESECPFCHRLFCGQCSVPWHQGIECEAYQRLPEDERGRDDLTMRELVVEKKWARCPKCKFYVERTEGCPHITCRCMYEFCYGCESKWSQSHAGCQRK